MRYRELQIDDYAAIMALWRDTDGIGLRDSDSIEGLAVYLERNPGLSFVAELEKQIIGTIMAGHDGKRGYIQHLAVAEDWRGQGIGRQLTTLCLDALAAAGVLKSHVHVYAHNREGRRFWESKGWHHREELVTYSYISGDNPNV